MRGDSQPHVGDRLLSARAARGGFECPLLLEFPGSHTRGPRAVGVAFGVITSESGKARGGLLAESKIWLDRWDNAWPKPSRHPELCREVLAGAAGELEAMLRDVTRASSRPGAVEEVARRVTEIVTKMRVEAWFEVDLVMDGSVTNHADEDETLPARSEQEKVTGWFFPSAEKKAHFDGGDGRSLCGKWGRTGFGGSAEIQGDASSPPSGDDCVACRRKLEASTQSGLAGGRAKGTKRSSRSPSSASRPKGFGRCRMAWLAVRRSLAQCCCVRNAPAKSRHRFRRRARRPHQVPTGREQRPASSRNSYS